MGVDARGLKTGATGRAISRANPEWRREFELTLPDLTEEDIGGSCFAIQDYSVAKSLGGPSALEAVPPAPREARSSLMLDFVPNHMALDHPWVMAHPDYLLQEAIGSLRWPPELLQGGWRTDPCARPGSVFPRLAGHGPARLRQPRGSGGDDG